VAFSFIIKSTSYNPAKGPSSLLMLLARKFSEHYDGYDGQI
jgi:hypothetical protein